jgi:hypothetical protein
VILPVEVAVVLPQRHSRSGILDELLRNIVRSAPRFYEPTVHCAGIGPSLIELPSAPGRMSANWPREL